MVVQHNKAAAANEQLYTQFCIGVELGDDTLVRWTVERKVPSPEVAATGWPMMGIYQGKGWMAPDFNEIPEGFEEYVK